MALNNGDRIPEASFMTMGEKGQQPISTDQAPRGNRQNNLALGVAVTGRLANS